MAFPNTTLIIDSLNTVWRESKKHDLLWIIAKDNLQDTLLGDEPRRGPPVGAVCVIDKDKSIWCMSKEVDYSWRARAEWVKVERKEK